MTEGRRSRIGWAAFPTPPMRRRRGWRSVWILATVLNMVLSLLLFAYVVVLKSSRDTEQQRIEHQIVDNNCALMNRLPAGGPLDPLRAYYHCGPGI